MTIFVDPYHTTAGMTLDMNRVVAMLKECTIRDPLQGTNLGVRSADGIIPVFITGCRDSEDKVPPFTHSILIKNFNGKSYLFTDMRLFIKAGATLADLDSHIRRREEFEFTKARAIASLAWAAQDTERFATGLGFAGEVFASWIGQTLAQNYALDFIAQKTVELLSFAFYQSLFSDKPLAMKENDDLAIMTAKKASDLFKVPTSRVLALYQTIDAPMVSVADLVTQIVKTLDHVALNPVPNRPESGLNLRVLLNLISDAWFSTNSKQILATAIEHPPTLCAIIYYCLNFNNFRRQKLGQIIQSCSRGDKGKSFSQSFGVMLEYYLKEPEKLLGVMEYLNPEAFTGENADGALDSLLRELHVDDSEQGSFKELLAPEDTLESLESRING